MPAHPLANVPLMVSVALAADNQNQSVMLIILATSLFGEFCLMFLIIACDLTSYDPSRLLPRSL